MSAVTEEAYRPPAPPPNTVQNVVLANLAVPIALIALPIFLATGLPVQRVGDRDGPLARQPSDPAGRQPLHHRAAADDRDGRRRGDVHHARLGRAARTRARRALRRTRRRDCPRPSSSPCSTPATWSRAVSSTPTAVAGCGDAPVMLARRLPLFVLPLALALTVPSLALADEPKVDPTKEFLLHPYIEFKPFSWLDLSITKPVIYLHRRRPDRHDRPDPDHPRRPAPEARPRAGGDRDRLRLHRDHHRPRVAAGEDLHDRGSRTSRRCSSSSGSRT